MNDTYANRPKVRAYHLTPDQLRAAYQEATVDQFFTGLAHTRLEVLRRELEKEREQPSEEAVP